MNALVQFGFLFLLLILFWAVAMRPARRQRENLAQLQDGLQVGDEVVTTSGIFGSVAQLAETRIGLEIAPGIVIEVARQAIARKVADVELGRETDDADESDHVEAGDE